MQAMVWLALRALYSLRLFSHAPVEALICTFGAGASSERSLSPALNARGASLGCFQVPNAERLVSEQQASLVGQRRETLRRAFLIYLWFGILSRASKRLYKVPNQGYLYMGAHHYR